MIEMSEKPPAQAPAPAPSEPAKEPVKQEKKPLETEVGDAVERMLGAMPKDTRKSVEKRISGKSLEEKYAIVSSVSEFVSKPTEHAGTGPIPAARSDGKQTINVPDFRDKNSRAVNDIKWPDDTWNRGPGYTRTLAGKLKQAEEKS